MASATVTTRDGVRKNPEYSLPVSEDPFIEIIRQIYGIDQLNPPTIRFSGAA